ncbi:EthD domain-containing protein [Seinonella peptonophila]|uniref:EthD domain-containing protein n=1 Tax=Seinonella peptonophila TaxID=112248 RepID=A0A1M4Y9V6_9BACL|nr:EthD domain-containing protein [Seinonella peptonophila]SHF02428.1 EthD domain-containing protein [Seinonella peptonophila]
MVKVVCLFNQVDEPRELSAFLYDELIPMLKETIEVIRFEVTDFKLNPVAALQGKNPLPTFAYMIEIYYPSVEIYEKALKDPQGQEVFNHLLTVCEEIIEVGLGNVQLVRK